MFSDTPKAPNSCGSLQHVRLLPDLSIKILGSSPVWILMLAKSFSDSKRKNLQVSSWNKGESNSTIN